VKQSLRNHRVPHVKSCYCIQGKGEKEDAMRETTFFWQSQQTEYLVRGVRRRGIKEKSERNKTDRKELSGMSQVRFVATGGKKERKSRKS